MEGYRINVIILVVVFIVEKNRDVGLNMRLRVNIAQNNPVFCYG